jgi:hypothetical protein
VRVGILPTHQFPDGGAGRVRNVADPAVAGAEFVEVEVVIGGVKDVIPFAPADLTPIKRGQAAPVAQTVARRAPTRAARSARPRAAASAPASEATTSRGHDPGLVGGVGSGAEPAVRAPAPVVSAPAVSASAVSTPTAPAPAASTPALSAPAVTAAAPAEEPDAPARRSRPRGRPTRTVPAAVRITVATVEPDHEQWHAEVVVDAKPVGRPVPVSPAQVWSLVGQLGVPAAERAVGQALSVHRERARQRAEQLAKELAAAEAELARYPAPG